MKACSRCRKSKPFSDFYRKKTRSATRLVGAARYYTWCKECSRAYMNARRQADPEGEKLRYQRTKGNPARVMLAAARHRAQKRGVPCTIKEHEIRELLRTTKVCPVLGIPLYRGMWAKSDNSPSLDAIKPDLGYVSGNVAIISYRANRIKADATPEELQKILDWLARHELREEFD
jgi:hypothetical protein